MRLYMRVLILGTCTTESYTHQPYMNKKLHVHPPKAQYKPYFI